MLMSLMIHAEAETISRDLGNLTDNFETTPPRINPKPFEIVDCAFDFEWKDGKFLESDDDQK